MTTQRHPIITLYGTLEGDPERREVPETTILRWHYDPALDRDLATPITRPARTFHTFSLTVFIRKAPEQRRSIKCIDWRAQIATFRKGQGLRLTGFFQERIAVRHGSPTRVRRFVVKSAELAKVRR